MSGLDRKRRLLLSGLALAPLALRAKARASVVIVGGGFGGAACARLLGERAPEIDVTLIEPRRHFMTGPFTNLALCGVLEPSAIRFSPASLSDRYNTNWIAATAVSLDPVTRTVVLDDGRRIRGDRIVVAPGVRMLYDEIDGLNARNSAQVPHAWLGGDQVLQLRRRLLALRDGATVVIVAPAGSYRCPPGPYERASLMAWRLRQQGSRGKLLILDAKDDFTLRGPMQVGWGELYPDTIEWVSRTNGGQVYGVRPEANTLELFNGERVKADLISLIPPQEAGSFAQRADLTDIGGWCPVDLRSFESLRHSGIHVIGDAAQTVPMPKSAYAANTQGKLCALAIIAALRGDEAPPDALMTNTCYNLLAPHYGVSVSATYRVVGDRINAISSGQSPSIAPLTVRRQEARYAYSWYDNITRDTFL